MNDLNISIVERDFPLVFETVELIKHTTKNELREKNLCLFYFDELKQSGNSAQTQRIDLCILSVPRDIHRALQIHNQAAVEMPDAAILSFCDDRQVSLELSGVLSENEFSGWTWANFERYRVKVIGALQAAIRCRTTRNNHETDHRTFSYKNNYPTHLNLA